MGIFHGKIFGGPRSIALCEILWVKWSRKANFWNLFIDNLQARSKLAMVYNRDEFPPIQLSWKYSKKWWNAGASLFNPFQATPHKCQKTNFFRRNGIRLDEMGWHQIHVLLFFTRTKQPHTFPNLAEQDPTGWLTKTTPSPQYAEIHTLQLSS